MAYIPKIYRDLGGDRMIFEAGSVLDVRGQIIPPDRFTRFYYVDGTNGDDDYDGLSAQRPFATIMAAMDAITARGALRGRSAVYVAPGGYNEDVVTPLNSIAPFGALIGTSPTDPSFGGTYMYAATATEPTLKIRARGWLVRGFEIGAPTTDGCVLLDAAATGGRLSSGTVIEDCILGGWGQGDFGIDTIYNGAPHTTLRRCMLTGIVGPAIKCSESGHDQPRHWTIEDCWFVDNSDHIAMNPRGFKESRIQRSTFIKVGANRTATLQLDNRGGNACAIGPDNFLSSTYDHAGGYRAGANEHWYGNASEDGFTNANPAA